MPSGMFIDPQMFARYQNGAALYDAAMGANGWRPAGNIVPDFQPYLDSMLGPEYMQTRGGYLLPDRPASLAEQQPGYVEWADLQGERQPSTATRGLGWSEIQGNSLEQQPGYTTWQDLQGERQPSLATRGFGSSEIRGSALQNELPGGVPMENARNAVRWGTRIGGALAGGLPGIAAAGATYAIPALWDHILRTSDQFRDVDFGPMMPADIAEPLP